MNTDAEQARDEAMASVHAGADPYWVECATNSVKLLCNILRPGAKITTDSVWMILEEEFPNAKTHDPRALGPIMSGARRDGLITPTGEYKKSIRVECHARPVAVWMVR